MSNILDLSVIIPKSLIIKVKNGDEFEIPGTISLGMVLKMESEQEEILKLKDGMENYKFMKKTITEILKLDTEKAKKVTDKYITDNNLDSLAYMQAIRDSFIKHVTNVRDNENLDSPQS